MQTSTFKLCNNKNFIKICRYLKERNAQFEQQQKEKAEQEKLAELRGLNDPRCPPGHMLMPKEELQHHLKEMETG